MSSKNLSYIYFGIAKDRYGFKIGVSLNPKQRTSQIPEKIDLYSSIQFSCHKSDAFHIEKSIHFLFNKHHLSKEKSDGYTEWFDISAFDEILNFVINNQDKFKWISYEPILKSADVTIPDIDQEYIKLYIQDLGRLKGLQPSHREILVYVAACVGYDGIITLTARRRGSIALTVGCNQRTVDNAVSEYVKTGIVRRVGRGEYELNPFLFAKGDWNSIRQRREGFVSSVAYDPKLGRVPVEIRPLSSDEKERLQMENQGQKQIDQ
jgi:hypothetical protein